MPVLSAVIRRRAGRAASTGRVSAGLVRASHAMALSGVLLACCVLGTSLAHAADVAPPAPSTVKVGRNAERQAAPPTDEAVQAEEPEGDPVLVRPFLQIIYAAVDFSTDDADTQLEITPNPTSNLGATLGAWGFSLSVSFDVGRVEPVDEYGNSDNFNFEFTYPFRILGERELDLTAFLHYHQTLSMSRPGAPRQIVDDATITTLGLEAAFVFDPEFSIADAFSDFAPRRGSRGSWFVRSSLEFWFLGFLEDSERRLIPDALSDGFGDFVDLSGLNQANLTLGGGYAYDWNVGGDFFLSALGHLGVSTTVIELSFSSTDTERTDAYGGAFGVQLAASYVSRGFHAGLVSSGVADLVTTHDVDVVTQRLSSTLFAGMRF